MTIIDILVSIDIIFELSRVNDLSLDERNSAFVTAMLVVAEAAV